MSFSETLEQKQSLATKIIYTLSIIIPLVVLVLMYLPQRYDVLGLEVGTLPFFHAVINGTTAVLLMLGLYFIKNKNPKAHKRTMITAFLLSGVFLVSYVISKISTPPVSYGGEVLWLKYVYYFILITHIILSAIIVPLVLFTIYFSYSGKLAKHRRIAKYTFPIWLYVAITGVLVYVFMAPYY